MSELDALLRSCTGRSVLDVLSGTIPSLALIADSEGRILSASQFVMDFAGWTPDSVGAMTIADLRERLQTGDRQGRLLRLDELPIARALSGEPVRGAECSFLDRNGERVPVVMNAAPIRNAESQVIGAFAAAVDLRRFAMLERELFACIAEKEMLYRELAHRVRNHLQIFIGLLGLETRDAGPAAAEMAARMQGRLKTLASVYDQMDQAEVGGRVDARAFIEEVVSPYRTPAITIDVRTADGLTLEPDQAGPLGMLVNEAVCNAYKHAFPGRDGGRIEVSLRPVSPARLDLSVADDGVGYAGQADPSSQGLKLMRVLADQLGGDVEVRSGSAGGVVVQVSLPNAMTQG